MAATSNVPGSGPTSIDYLGEDSPRVGDGLLRAETRVEQEVHDAGPSNWWRLGLLALFLIAVLLVGAQWLSGNHGTDVVPGTPITAPQNG